MCQSFYRRPGSWGMLFAGLLLTSLTCAGPAIAADCGNGRSSPLSSSLYTITTRITGCDGAAVGFEVLVKARVAYQVRDRIFGTVLDSGEEIVLLAEETTDANGRTSSTVNWCEAIAPHIPVVPSTLVVNSSARVFVEVRRPSGTVSLWTSGYRDMREGNTLAFFGDIGATSYCNTAGQPTVDIESPLDGTVIAADPCPISICYTFVDFEVDVTASARLQRVTFEVYDLEGNFHDSGPLCVYDPVESEYCGSTSPPYTATR